MNNRRERHVVVAQVDRQSERKKRNSVPHSVESMKKIIKTSCYIAGALDMLSLMALDSEAIKQEICRLERTRRLMTDRIRLIWKKLDTLNEELRISEEGENSENRTGI